MKDRTQTPCRRTAAVAEAFTEGRRDRVAGHLATCAECAAEWAALESLAEAARTVRTTPLDESAKDEIRARLLVGARAVAGTTPSRKRRGRRGAIAVAALGLAVAVTAMFVRAPVHTVATARTSHLFLRRATVRGHRGATYAAISAQPDEVVRLYEGTITVDVDPLRVGERFRVVTNNAQIEVVGTVFDATARGGELTKVSVQRGRVEVRGPSEVLEVITAGQRWDSPARPDDEAPEVSMASPSTTAETSGTDTPLAATPSDVGHQTRPSPSEAELAFQRGWAALRDGDAEGASRAFAGVPEDAPLGPDATFWRGVALARAGHETEAMVVLERFLQARPASPHAAQARATLAKLRAEVAKRRRTGSP